MIGEHPRAVHPPQAQDNGRNESKKRLIISLVVLAAFLGALLYDYWPDLLQTAARAANVTREIGSKPIQSRYFEVRNISSAGDPQVASAVGVLEKQYQAITGFLKVTPDDPLPVLFVNGSTPSFGDGAQLVVNDNKGVIDTDLAPIFMVLMIDDVKLNLAGQFIPTGGYALYVTEAAGLSRRLTWQPLDDWAVLLRSRKVYIPLKEAWDMKVPSDDNGAYDLLRAMLESGSFMGWFSDRYGLGAARLVAQGETVEKVSGKTLAENETEWLAALDAQKLHPRSCAAAIPTGTMFHFMCSKLDSGLQ